MRASSLGGIKIGNNLNISASTGVLDAVMNLNNETTAQNLPVVNGTCTLLMNIQITAAKTYALQKIQTSAAAWVTLYVSTAARTADASRNETTDPLPGAGVIAEVTLVVMHLNLLLHLNLIWFN